jgi:hypothetical protein
MTIVSLLTDDGGEEPLPEADDAFDRFLASLYRSLHPTTRAFVDFHNSKEQTALFHTAPHRALYRSAVALHSTGLLTHAVHSVWPFSTWAREVLLDAAALLTAPLAFLAGFVCGQALPLETLPAIQAEDKRKLAPPRPSLANVAIYFVLPGVLLWFGRDIVRLVVRKSVVELVVGSSSSSAERVQHAAAALLLAGVGAHQGVWSALRLKKAQHDAFFSDDGRHRFELVQQLASSVVRAQQMHVTARTRRRALILLNLSVSAALAWQHFFWARRLASPATAAFVALTFVPVVAFHLKHKFVS